MAVSARASGENVTEKFAAAWPGVRRRLKAVACALRLDPYTAEDLIQEVGARVWALRVAFQGEEDLYPWARVVLHNLAVDHWRRAAKVSLDEPPERASSSAEDEALSAEDQSEQRRCLGVIERHLAAMAPARRAEVLEALRTDRPVPADAKEAAMWRQRRHRARASLAELLERMGAGVLAFKRRLWEVLAPSRSGWLDQLANPALAAVLALPALVGLGHSPAPGPRPAPKPPAAVLAETLSSPVAGGRAASAPAVAPSSGAASPPPGRASRPQPGHLVPGEGDRAAAVVPGPNGPIGSADWYYKPDTPALVCLQSFVGSTCVVTPFYGLPSG